MDSGLANDPRSLALGYGAPVDEAGVFPLPIAFGLADLPAALPGTVMVQIQIQIQIKSDRQPVGKAAGLGIVSPSENTMPTKRAPRAKTETPSANVRKKNCVPVRCLDQRQRPLWSVSERNVACQPDALCRDKDPCGQCL